MFDFDIKELSDNENILLKEIFSNPVVIKYLKILGQQVGNDILNNLPSLTVDTEDYRRRLIYEQGKLAILETQLTIKEL